MNILMMTNTFIPHVGGVARSVQSFTEGYRKHGHRVMVVAPEYENMPENEVGVIRIPAIQHFKGSDFSVLLPIPGFLTRAIEKFKPDIVHTHHPFLIGETALRVAHILELPLVFTHHTMYEQYTHYVPGNSKALKRFAKDLSTRYANLCDQIFAPSESIASVLLKRGVETPITVVPTGVHFDQFTGGSGTGFQMAMGIPEDAFVVGHVGRLALEKNLQFLTAAVTKFLKAESRAHFLVIGRGPSEKAIQEIFFRKGLQGRLHFAGSLDYPLLTSAYKAMDVFAFASKSETQGMVLSEAMAAGVPVVALDAPGAREVVTDQVNGRLLGSESVEEFASALQWIAAFAPKKRHELRQGAVQTAQLFSIDRSVKKALTCYEILLEKEPASRHDKFHTWAAALRLVKTDWDVLKMLVGAADTAFSSDEPKGETKS
jgi:1,2-diacylglycerol 3-alpha-glucosyltransferase